LKTCKGQSCQEELTFVCNFYSSDIEQQQLECQFPLLHSLIKQATELPSCDKELSIPFVVEVLSDLSCAQRVAFSEVLKIMNLLLVLPATNASPERSFSALRRVKSYLRSSMTQVRLNNLMVVHVCKDETDSLNLRKILNEFISVKDSRKHLFATY